MIYFALMYQALYAEMREGLLADDTDFATRQVREHLKSK